MAADEKGKNEANPKPASNPKPAKADGTKNAFDFETTKANAETTVAREQTDPLTAAGNTTVQDGPENTVQDGPENDEAATGVLGSNHGDFSPSTATVSQLERAELSDVAKNERKRIDSLPDVAMYNPNAGLVPRVGGPYLDNLENERAEVQRAVFENREPDFTNMAGSAGVTLVTAGQLANMHTSSNPAALGEFIEAHKDDDKLGPTPITTVPMAGTNLEVIEAAEAEKKARKEWDNSTVTSHDNPDVVFTESATRDAAR